MFKKHTNLKILRKKYYFKKNTQKKEKIKFKFLFKTKYINIYSLTLHTIIFFATNFN